MAKVDFTEKELVNNAHIKELFEVAQREMEKINKRNDDNYDLMKAMHSESAVPCKSEAE